MFLPYLGLLIVVCCGAYVLGQHTSYINDLEKRVKRLENKNNDTNAKPEELYEIEVTNADGTYKIKTI